MKADRSWQFVHNSNILSEKLEYIDEGQVFYIYTSFMKSQYEVSVMTC
jgi:hypothetical protein